MCDFFYCIIKVINYEFLNQFLIFKSKNLIFKFIKKKFLWKKFCCSFFIIISKFTKFLFASNLYNHYITTVNIVTRFCHIIDFSIPSIIQQFPPQQLLPGGVPGQNQHNCWPGWHHWKNNKNNRLIWIESIDSDDWVVSESALIPIFSLFFSIF